MSDEPPGDVPAASDPSKLVRQLRRAMRDKPLQASRRPEAPAEPPAADREPAPPVEPASEPARRRPRDRTIAAVATLALLIAAVPVLTWYGFHLVLSARGGSAVSTVRDPHAAGYLALVTPTPTALVVQVDAQNQPVSLTLLSLTMQDKGGGTVVFIPLDTDVPVPSYGIDRLRTAYARGGATALAAATSQVLGIGFTQVVTVDPDKLTSLVQPVAPLSVDNPDRVTTSSGTFAEGSIQLSASQVPTYLAARRSGESDLERLNRQMQLWTAWLGAIEKAPSSAAAVPGESSTGIGHFLRVLAAGQVTFDVLPVTADPTPLNDGTQVFHADDAAVGKLVALTVPYPVGNGDQRLTVRLLNGANGDGIAPSLVQRVVLGGGQISEIGNATRFGTTTTEIHYSDPAVKKAADRLQFALGGKAREVLVDAGDDTVQVTVVLGSDLVAHPPPALVQTEVAGG